MPSLLVTNDFPPKLGGIQSYLWELWRRLPREQVRVFTTRRGGAQVFDTAQPFPIERSRQKVLLPTRRLRLEIEARNADVVFLDPALPLGAIGPRLGRPYVVIVHGAEVKAYGRLAPRRMQRVLTQAAGILAAGTYPAREAERAARRSLSGLVIPPGVDSDRFRPLTLDERAAARKRFGLPVDRPLVLGVSRLVPRKGFDVLIDAVAGLSGDVQLAIAGAGRDRRRLEARARRRGVDARFLGRVPDADLPPLYGAADVFSMLCRDRWRGLEQEGFGIVFLEAGACGVAAVAGRSGGSHEAVVDGETGYVVDPRDAGEARERIAAVLGDPSTMGKAARVRAETEFNLDALAARLAPLASGDLGVLPPL